ncbi:class I SAM-dependent methyltransferase [Flavobacterium paronense]|uniref:Class I SAM-dependent methyltransferase n=1 Tax=Flavobacterium paronense TaxID=1392775 RepID=A0ABV5GC03_9FLAO|nr:class I SAM-dependent methyltransferase [Flavobacterium paronense]MDN3676700.1 class I SAM-dependent methyltransferase [Flavobacterium paronense]
MLHKIINIFKNKSNEKILSDSIKEIHSQIPQDFGGGCSHHKALLMGLVISEFNLKNSADIGVYRGRSLFPQAIAHKLHTKGLVYGIDPYSNEAAVQNDRPDLQEQLDEFITVTDFQKLYDDVSNLIKKNEYQNNCVLVRKKSSQAAIDFKASNTKFGLVHIDGNHDTKFVMEDVANYFPLLDDKSFIVLDDISWDSVQPAFTLLNKEMIFIDKLINETNDFALFGKGISNEEILLLKEIFKKIKKK